MKIVSFVVAAIAAVLLGAGLIIGLGLNVSDAAGYDCGSALKESSDLYSDQLTDTMLGGTGETGCDAARAAAKPLPIVLLVLGGVGALGAAVLYMSERRQGKAQSVST